MYRLSTTDTKGQCFREVQVDCIFPENTYIFCLGGVTVLNATFNNISVISYIWRSVLLMEDMVSLDKTIDIFFILCLYTIY